MLEEKANGWRDGRCAGDSQVGKECRGVNAK
jgi:hypothetical protein